MADIVRDYPQDNDFTVTLDGPDESVWLTWQGLSVHLMVAEGSAVVEVFDRGEEMAPPLGLIEVVQ